MIRGVYCLKRSGRLVILYNVENYEDRKSRFTICSWDDQNGTYKKVLITQKQYKSFCYIGAL